MPKTRAGRKAKAQNKASTMTEDVSELSPKEQLQDVLRAIEPQILQMIDRNCRKFEREALKCLRQLPDKQSIPPEIYNMPFSEFIARGGYMDKVMESLRKEKIDKALDQSTLLAKENLTTINDKLTLPSSLPKEIEQPISTRLRTRCMAMVPKATEGTEEIMTRTKSKKKATAAKTKGDIENSYVTPAAGNRSQTVIPPSTAMRLPKPLEEVKLTVTSKETGSPLNAMETILVDMMDKCLKEVLPKRSRPQTLKAIEESFLQEMKGRFRQEGEAVSIVTPSVANNTRSRRVIKH